MAIVNIRDLFEPMSFPLSNLTGAIALFAVLFAGCSKISPEEAVSKGQQALANGRYEEAATYLKTASKAYPENAAVFYNLGMANLLANHNRAAESAFQRAIELEKDPENTAAYQGLGEARRKRGNFEGASAAYRVAIQRSFRKPDLLAGLAACEMGAGIIGSACNYLNEALELDPNNPVALYNDAILHSRPASEYFDQTRAAKHFWEFLGSTVANENPEQREIAIRKLAELNKNRSPELQDQIDNFVMISYDNPPRIRAQRLAEAIKMDYSNYELWEIFISALEAAKLTPEAIESVRRKCAIRFPGNPAFQKTVP